MSVMEFIYFPLLERLWYELAMTTNADMSRINRSHFTTNERTAVKGKYVLCATHRANNLSIR